ncbi:MAG: VOC family protein [Gammaproteobacteria bacterium]|nr:VOC family protein [Gammaproteobacteria bacterium]
MKPPFNYRKLAYAALDVTDLDASVRFYRDLVGLDLVQQDETVAFLRCSRDHHNLVLYRGAVPGLRRAAYEMAGAADLEAAFEFHAARGLAPRWLDEAACRVLNQGRTFRVREPASGLTFELFDRMTQLALPYRHTVTKIARLGHIVVGTPDYDAARARLMDDFNFAVSDFVEGRFSWMRCYPNPLHHTFAMGLSERRHLHHVNFMVTDVDDIGEAMNRMKKAGVEIVFGPGRHLPSTSIFLYFLDPDGMTIEFSFGMEEIPAGNGRLPRMLEMHPNTMDIWGSSPAPRFGKGGAIGDGDD